MLELFILKGIIFMFSAVLAGEFSVDPGRRLANQLNGLWNLPVLKLGNIPQHQTQLRVQPFLTHRTRLHHLL